MGNTINDVTRKLDDQIKKTSQLVASADAISSRLSEIRQEASGGFSELSTGMRSLASGIYEGFIELSYQQELVRRELEEIKEILTAPLGTEAKELRKRAEVAYLNGWIDEALVDLLESEKKNYQDFIVHQMIANIYYFHKTDFPKAVEYCKKAAKYAAPVSKTWFIYALSLLGRAHWKLGQLQEAYEATKRAREEKVCGPEVLYQHAQYAALLGHKQEAIDNLGIAILMDRDFCITADRDSMFDGMRAEVNNQIIKRIRQWVKTEAEQDLRECKESLNNLRSVKQDLFSLQQKVSKIEEIYQRDSLFDYLKVRLMALETHMAILSELIRIKEVPYRRAGEAALQLKEKSYRGIAWAAGISTFFLLVLLAKALEEAGEGGVSISGFVALMAFVLPFFVGPRVAKALKQSDLSHQERIRKSEESKLEPLWKKDEEIKARYELLRRAGNQIILKKA